MQLSLTTYQIQSHFCCFPHNTTHNRQYNMCPEQSRMCLVSCTNSTLLDRKYTTHVSINIMTANNNQLSFCLNTNLIGTLVNYSVDSHPPCLAHQIMFACWLPLLQRLKPSHWWLKALQHWQSQKSSFDRFHKKCVC